MAAGSGGPEGVLLLRLPFALLQAPALPLPPCSRATTASAVSCGLWPMLTLPTPWLAPPTAMTFWY